VSSLIIPPQLRAWPNPHVPPLLEKFGAAGMTAPYTPPDCDFLLICFVNRCGSFYLAQLLAGSGLFNEAGEYFNAETVLEHSNRLSLTSFAAYVEALHGIVGSPQHFTAKLGIGQLVMLHDCGILQKIIPSTKFLLIERQDKLAQAISRVIASQNQFWTSEHQALIPDSALRYDRGAIDLEYRLCSEATFGFYRFFSANNIVPVHVTYESLRHDPAAILAAIGEGLGLGPIPYNPHSVRLRRQANAINDAWRERYQSGA
jgi:LPS sulfotransferase NodH